MNDTKVKKFKKISENKTFLALFPEKFVGTQIIYYCSLFYKITTNKNDQNECQYVK